MNQPNNETKAVERDAETAEPQQRGYVLCQRGVTPKA